MSLPLIAAERGPDFPIGIWKDQTYSIHSHPSDYFVQAGNLYRKVMTREDRDHLVGNIVNHLGGARKRIQKRPVRAIFQGGPDYGRGIAKGLDLDGGEIEKLAALSQEERVKAMAEGSWAEASQIRR